MYQLRILFESESTDPLSATEFWSLCQQREDFRAAYHQYWNSSREKTSSKRPVDGVILPVAPSAAVQQGLFTYYGSFSHMSEANLASSFER